MESPIAVTKLGKYRGHYVQTLGGRQVAAFNGIRYAKPPLHKLRFKEAVKIDAHEGIYDATKDGDDCVQESQSYCKYTAQEKQGKKYVGSEDCLFLNLYSPQTKPEKPYPVIVYLHGGAFYKGTGSINFHGPELLLEKDLILVTITYRLNVFGFLSFDDEILPGNLGLKDQSLALHWIKDNISCFGGDPESITLMGHSAGSICAELQMLSPRNKGIIKGVITQSANVLCPPAIVKREEAKEVALEFASVLNCPTTPAEMLASLQEKTVDEIMTAVFKLVVKFRIRLGHTVFGPVIEEQKESFITNEDIMAGSTVPMLVAVARDEGLIVYRDEFRKGDEHLSFINENYKQVLPYAFHYDNHPEKEKITEEIKQYYLGNDDISKKSVQQFSKMVGDGLFVHGILNTVKRHKGKSYLCLLTHQGQRSFTNELPVSGICHGDELFYLFPFSPIKTKLKFNEEDSKVQKLFVELWSNFATYGDPTPSGEETKWLESEKGKNFVSITSDGIQPSQHLFSSRMKFWDKLNLNSY